MPTGVTGQTQIDQALPTLVENADTFREHKGLVKKLFDRKRLGRKSGRTWNEPIFATASAVAVTDGVAIDSPNQITDTLLTITPSRVAAQILWTDRMNDTISEDFVAAAADLIANALEYRLDTDCLTQGASFSTTRGGSTVTLTPGLISAAAAGVRSGRVGTIRTGGRTTGDPLVAGAGLIHGVFHPFHEHDLAMNLGGQAGGGAATQYGAGTAMIGNYAAVGTGQSPKWLTDYFFDTIRGVQVHLDGNFTITSNAISAFVHTPRAEVLVDFITMGDYVFRTEDGQARLQTMWSDYGLGERADNGGCVITLDATAPTS